MAFVRNEKKYICTPHLIEIFKARLKGLLRQDSNAKNFNYQVFSLYFDSDINISVYENELGAAKRAKYRIRYYNDCDGLKLEKKQKINGLIHKTATPITRQTAEKLMRGDAAEFLHSKDPILRELAIKIMTEHFTPKVIIAYTRYPFVCPTSNIRVTLDTNICCSYQTDLFLKGTFARIPLNSTGANLMEVKYDKVLPSYIKSVISEPNLTQSTFSKYYLGRKKTAEFGR